MPLMNMNRPPNLNLGLNASARIWTWKSRGQSLNWNSWWPFIRGDRISRILPRWQMEAHLIGWLSGTWSLCSHAHRLSLWAFSLCSKSHEPLMSRETVLKGFKKLVKIMPSHRLLNKSLLCPDFLISCHWTISRIWTLAPKQNTAYLSCQER